LTGWFSCSSYIFKEKLKGSTSDSFPSEAWVSSWQHSVVLEHTFKSFSREVRNLILEVLRAHNKVS
jgi:uncharacterized protein YjlB